MKIFNRKTGVSTIAALFALLSMVAMGTVIAYLVAAGSESRTNHLLASQAFYVTQAGIEYGVRKIYEGASPVVASPGVSFGKGSFTISQSGKTLTVTGTVGNAVRIHKVDSPTEADCTKIDTSNVNLGSNDTKVQQITFRKICLTQITIDKMQYSWTPDNGEKLTEIKIENIKVYDNPAGAPSGTLLDIADYVVTTGNNTVINWIQFNGDMENKTMTFTWTFGDSSTKTETFEIED